MVLVGDWVLSGSFKYLLAFSYDWFLCIVISFSFLDLD